MYVKQLLLILCVTDVPLILFLPLADPHAILLQPRKMVQLDPTTFSRLAAAIATRFDKQANQIKSLIPKAVEQWARVRRDGGGDTMKAFEMVNKNRKVQRDATYVKVCL